MPGYRSVLVDLRGHGRSTRRLTDVSREAFVSDVVQVIEQIVGEAVTLVGQSMGGHTAMLVAANRPDLVSRLVLLETGPGGGTAKEHLALGEYFRSWPVPFPDHITAQSFLGDGPLHRAWVADLQRHDDGLRPRFDADIMVKVIRELVAPRWQEWESVACPTLVVFGSEGMFSEEEKALFVNRGRNVQRVDLNGASHDAHLDAAARWREELQAFLKCHTDFTKSGPRGALDVG